MGSNNWSGSTAPTIPGTTTTHPGKRTGFCRLSAARLDRLVTLVADLGAPAASGQARFLPGSGPPSPWPDLRGASGYGALSDDDLDNLRFRLKFRLVAPIRELLLESLQSLHDLDFAVAPKQNSPPVPTYPEAEKAYLASLEGSSPEQLRVARLAYEEVIERDLIGPLQLSGAG